MSHCSHCSSNRPSTRFCHSNLAYTHHIHTQLRIMYAPATARAFPPTALLTSIVRSSVRTRVSYGHSDHDGRFYYIKYTVLYYVIHVLLYMLLVIPFPSFFLGRGRRRPTSLSVPSGPPDALAHQESPQDQAEPGLVLQLINTALPRSRVFGTHACARRKSGVMGGYLIAPT